MSLLRVLGAIASSGGAAPPVFGDAGMVLITPTTIAHTGTSASIGTNGQVTFTTVSSLSLNGVFDATYNNYMLCIRLTSSDVNPTLYWRGRISGSDTSTGYTYQYLEISNTNENAFRNTSTFGYLMIPSSNTNNLSWVYLYGPYLNQQTISRGISMSRAGSGRIDDAVSTQGNNLVFDGITLYPNTGTMTGTVSVMGVVA